jgi:phage-related protein
VQIKIKHLKEKIITISTTNNLNALFLVDSFVVLHTAPEAVDYEMKLEPMRVAVLRPTKLGIDLPKQPKL